MTTTGDRIRRARIHSGMTAEELASKVGYATQSGIANLENRATGRGGYRLPRIAQVLNVSLNWLLSGPDDIQMSEVPAYDSATPNNYIASAQLPADSYGVMQPCELNWPFKKITPEQWESLPMNARELIERQIRGILIADVTSSHT